MTKTRMFFASLLLAAALGAPASPLLARQDPPEAPAEQVPPAAQADDQGVTIRRIGPPAVRIGQNYTLAAGQTAREVVVISGSARIDGEVLQDMVVVLGSVELGPSAVLHRDLVVVGGMLTIDPGAVVQRDLVAVISGYDAPSDFSARREQVIVGPPLGNAVEAVLPWVTQGLLWGRLIVPGMSWMWVVVAVLFGVYLLLSLVLEAPIRTTARTLTDKPLSAFLVGLFVLLLTGPVAFILAVSVVGIVVLPFLAVALVLAVVLGKVAVMRWIGAAVVVEDEPESRVQATRSFAMGFAVITLMYMVPVLGVVTFATIFVLGLGAATMALLGALRRENPKPRADSRQRVNPPPPAPPATPPPGPVSFTSATDPVGGMPLSVPVPPPASYATAPVPPPGDSGYEPGPAPDERQRQADAGAGETLATGFVPPPPPSPPPAGAAVGAETPLIAMPRAEFMDRAAAFGLDFLLVLLANAILDVSDDTSMFFLLLLVYHIAFWTWKGTTVGGIITNLRVIRTDGAPLQFGDALVRGLSSIFSLAVVGLGAFWILRDPERQSWHDRIAGTYVVKVPRSYPVS